MSVLQRPTARPTAQSDSRLGVLRSTAHFAALASLLLCLWPTTAAAQQLVYEPTHPAFGGSPLNYQWLLSSAQTQNAFQADRPSFRQDPLADFESSLQRQILNQLSRELIADRFGDDLDLTREGVFDVGEYTVEVIPGLDGTSIRVFNPVTGEETTVTIPRL
jgi:curli production assembly/transport component CsgF